MNLADNEGKKPYTKEHMLRDSFTKTATVICGEGGQTSWGMFTERGYEGTFWATGNVLCLDPGGDYASIYICNN